MVFQLLQMAASATLITFGMPLLGNVLLIVLLLTIVIQLVVRKQSMELATVSVLTLGTISPLVANSTALLFLTTMVP